MATTYTLISSNVLTSSAASVTFSSIPATYTDLVVRASVRTDFSSAYNNYRLRLNADTSSLYSYTRIVGVDTLAVSSRGSANTSILNGAANSDASTANTFTSLEIYIPNYLSTSNKPISIISNEEDNATEAYIAATAGLYRNTSAITSISIDSVTTSINLVSGSSFYLYGIKNS